MRILIIAILFFSAEVATAATLANTSADKPGSDGILLGHRGMAFKIERWILARLNGGDEVDLIVTHLRPGRKSESQVILQRIRVARIILDPKEPFGYIQLNLTPTGAARVAKALADGGVIDLARRHLDDQEIHPMEPASFRKLFPNCPECKKAEPMATADGGNPEEGP